MGTGQLLWGSCLSYCRMCLYNNNNNGPNGHLFYVSGDLNMRKGMLPIIIIPIALSAVWILTILGNVHIEENVVGWRNQLPMKTSAI